MFIPDPDFYPPRIQQQHQNKEGEKQIFCPTIFCSHKCHISINNMGLGSEIRDPKKTYPGSRVKKAPDPGSWTLILGNFFSRSPIFLPCSRHFVHLGLFGVISSQLMAQLLGRKKFGSVRIGIILPVPDPYPFHPIVKLCVSAPSPSRWDDRFRIYIPTLPLIFY